MASSFTTAGEPRAQGTHTQTEYRTLTVLSQPHKHLQFVPLPLVPGDNTLPIDAAIAAANAPPNTPFHIRTTSHTDTRTLRRLPNRLAAAFKFLHAAAVLDPPLARIPHTESGRTEVARQEAVRTHTHTHKHT